MSGSSQESTILLNKILSLTGAKFLGGPGIIWADSNSQISLSSLDPAWFFILTQYCIVKVSVAFGGCIGSSTTLLPHAMYFLASYLLTSRLLLSTMIFSTGLPFSCSFESIVTISKHLIFPFSSNSLLISGLHGQLGLSALVFIITSSHHSPPAGNSELQLAARNLYDRAGNKLS